MASTEIALLLDVVDRAWSRKSWHGPNLRGTLRGVTAVEALWRPGEGRHNIHELALHAAYWKHVSLRKLAGAGPDAFAYEGRDWFTAPSEPDEARWKRDLALLAKTQKALREVVAALRPRDLRARPMGSRYTALEIVEGLAAHDLYHAGQIQLIKRLMPGR
jgi:uncharacterized damage-inducible protein DinB